MVLVTVRGSICHRKSMWWQKRYLSCNPWEVPISRIYSIVYIFMRETITWKWFFGFYDKEGDFLLYVSFFFFFPNMWWMRQLCCTTICMWHPIYLLLSGFVCSCLLHKSILGFPAMHWTFLQNFLFFWLLSSADILIIFPLSNWPDSFFNIHSSFLP